MAGEVTVRGGGWRVKDVRGRDLVTPALPTMADTGEIDLRRFLRTLWRGKWILLLTMAVTILLQELSNARSDITGGFDGMSFTMDPLLGMFRFGLFFTTQYIYAVVVLLLAFFLVRRIVHAPFGRQLEGIRENVKRMHAIGSPVHHRLVTVYTISAALAGVAGGLFAQTQQFVTLHVLSFESLPAGRQR